MFSILTGIVLAGSLVTASYLSVFKANNKIREDIVKTNELQTAQKLSAIDDNKKIRLSNLIQSTDLSLQQKEDLDNFQKAVNQAVIEENMINPSCSDLAATNYISQAKCEIIKNSSNDYAKVDNGILSIDNPKMIKIINAKAEFKNSITTNGIAQIKTYSKAYLKNKQRKIQREKNTERKITKYISTITDIAKIDKYANNIKIADTNSTSGIDFNKEIKKLNLLVKLARRKKELQDNNTSTSATTVVAIPTYIKYDSNTTVNSTDVTPTVINNDVTPTVINNDVTPTVINNDINQLQTEENKMLQWFQ